MQDKNGRSRKDEDDGGAALALLLQRQRGLRRVECRLARGVGSCTTAAANSPGTKFLRITKPFVTLSVASAHNTLHRASLLPLRNTAPIGAEERFRFLTRHRVAPLRVDLILIERVGTVAASPTSIAPPAAARRRVRPRVCQDSTAWDGVELAIRFALLIIKDACGLPVGLRNRDGADLDATCGLAAQRLWCGGALACELARHGAGFAANGGGPRVFPAASGSAAERAALRGGERVGTACPRRFFAAAAASCEQRVVALSLDLRELGCELRRANVVRRERGRGHPLPVPNDAVLAAR